MNHARLCEDCGLKARNFGLPAEGKKRWCGGCAKRHTPGVVDVAKRSRQEGNRELIKL